MPPLRKISFIITLIVAHQLSAQKLYISVSGGPSFGAAKNTYRGYFDTTIDRDSLLIEDAKPISFGKGMGVHLRINYRLNRQIDFGVEASYLRGSTISIDKEQQGFDGNGQATIETIEYRIFGNLWSISPSITFSPISSRFSPYIRLGPNLNYAKTFERFSFNGQNQIESLEEFEGDLTFGFSGALGCKYLMNENWEVFTELRFQSFSFLPTKSKLTEYLYNGEDKLDELNTNERETIFKDRIEDPIGTDQGGAGSDFPLEKLSINQPFSSVQFLIGISYNL